MGCFSGRMMSSASYQNLFCEIFSVFNCSLDEFVEEKVVSPSYSSTILAPSSPSAIIRITKVELLVMVMDRGSLLVDRVNGHLCCPFMLSHGHPPPIYAQQVVTDRQKRWRFCLSIPVTEHKFLLLVSCSWFIKITWSDGSADGGNIVDSEAVMQEGDFSIER